MMMLKTIKKRELYDYPLPLMSRSPILNWYIDTLEYKFKTIHPKQLFSMNNLHLDCC